MSKTFPVCSGLIECVAHQVAAPERRNPDYVAKLVRTELETWRAPLLASGAALQ